MKKTKIKFYQITDITKNNINLINLCIMYLPNNYVKNGTKQIYLEPFFCL